MIRYLCDYHVLDILSMEELLYLVHEITLAIHTDPSFLDRLVKFLLNLLLTL